MCHMLVVFTLQKTNFLCIQGRRKESYRLSKSTLYLQPHVHAPNRFPQGRKSRNTLYVLFFLFWLISRTRRLHEILVLTLSVSYSSPSPRKTIQALGESFISKFTHHKSGVQKTSEVYHIFPQSLCFLSTQNCSSSQKQSFR